MLLIAWVESTFCALGNCTINSGPATFVANYNSSFPIILMGQPIRAPIMSTLVSVPLELIVKREPLAKVVFLGATDLTVSSKTNRMRYHKTFFYIQLKNKKLRPKFFKSFFKNFQNSRFSNDSIWI